MARGSRRYSGCWGSALPVRRCPEHLSSWRFALHLCLAIVEGTRPTRPLERTPPDSPASLPRSARTPASAPARPQTGWCGRGLCGGRLAIGESGQEGLLRWPLRTATRPGQGGSNRCGLVGTSSPAQRTGRCRPSSTRYAAWRPCAAQSGADGVRSRYARLCARSGADGLQVEGPRGQVARRARCTPGARAGPGYTDRGPRADLRTVTLARGAVPAARTGGCGRRCAGTGHTLDVLRMD